VDGLVLVIVHLLFPDIETKETRSNGTLHTSTEARLTSATIWQISMNESSLTTLRISRKQSVYLDSDLACHKNLIISIANILREFHGNPFRSFCAKLLTDRQRDRRQKIRSLAELIKINLAKQDNFLEQ